MKKEFLILSIIFILLISPTICSARSEIKREIELNVKDDLTFDKFYILNNYNLTYESKSSLR